MICDLKNQKNLKKCLTNSSQFNKEFILMQNSQPYLIQLDNITIKKVDNEKIGSHLIIKKSILTNC